MVKPEDITFALCRQRTPDEDEGVRVAIARRALADIHAAWRAHDEDEARHEDEARARFAYENVYVYGGYPYDEGVHEGADEGAPDPYACHICGMRGGH